MKHKKLFLNKQTISNLKNIKAGAQAVQIEPIQVTKDGGPSQCDTCLCAPTFWEGCQAVNIIAVD